MENQKGDKELLFLIEINSYLINYYRGNFDRWLAAALIEQDKILSPISTALNNANGNVSFYTYKDASEEILIKKILEIKEKTEKKLILKG